MLWAKRACMERKLLNEFSLELILQPKGQPRFQGVLGNYVYQI